MGDYLYRAARGVDLRPVRAHRLRKSIGGERTFGEDIDTPALLRETLANITDIVWERIVAAGGADGPVRGRTITLKLKYNDFRITTRSATSADWVAGREAFAATARGLLEAELPLARPIRLMGLTLSNLEGTQEARPPREEAQLSLL